MPIGRSHPAELARALRLEVQPRPHLGAAVEQRAQRQQREGPARVAVEAALNGRGHRRQRREPDSLRGGELITGPVNSPLASRGDPPTR